MPELTRSAPMPTDGSSALALDPTAFDQTAFDQLAPDRVPAQLRPALRVVPTADGGEPTETPLPPVRTLLRGLLEVLSGWRPAAQMALRVSPEIAADLLSRPRRRTAAPPPQVLRMRVLRVADDVVETCVVLRRGQRCGALAMRLEFGSRGWLVTRLQVG